MFVFVLSVVIVCLLDLFCFVFALVFVSGCIVFVVFVVCSVVVCFIL